MVDYFRAQSRPLAKAVSIQPVVFHPARLMDVAFALDPGPVAPIGEISITGAENVDPAVIRSFVYVEPGDAYSPKAMADMRKSIGRIQALGSVRIRESETLDAAGRLPVFVEVTERKPRVVGFSAPLFDDRRAGSACLLGASQSIRGAERLRVESDIFLAPRNDGTRIRRVGDLEPSDIGGRFRVSFLKPALYGSRNDLLIDGLLERDRTGGDRFGGYTSRLADITGVIRHRFSDTFSMQAGLQAQKGQTSDVLGFIDYFVVGTPVSLTYDFTGQTAGSLPRNAHHRIGRPVSDVPGFDRRHDRYQGDRIGILFAR